jgi:uncharacterized protein YyaL (SSP411 family)
LELLKDKDLIKGEKTIYVCQNYTCHSPVSTFEEMKKLIIND